MSAHALLRLDRPLSLRGAETMPMPSYAQRPERRPAARRDDRREPAPHRRALRRPRGARRPPPGLPRDLPRALGRRSTLAARGAARARRRQGRPRRHLGAEPLRVGRHCSTRPRASARSWSTSTRPTRRPSSSTRCSKSGVSVLLLARGFRERRLRAHARRGARPTARRCASRSCSTTTGTSFLADGDASPSDELAAARGALQFDDPINIQYTSGTTGFPKGATLSHHNILNNGYFIGEALRYTEHDRVCIPVPFYHCFGMVLGNLACTTHGACMVVPGEAFDAAGRARDGRRPSAAPRCTACRRCSSPSSSIRDFERVRPVRRCAPASWPARRARSR